MDDLISRPLSRHGGLALRHELLQDGATQDMLDRAWRSGELLRVRHGLYAAPDVPEPIVRAARVGGALAGPSSTSLIGGWQPHGSPLFVSTRANDHRLRHPDDAGRLLSRGEDGITVLRDAHHLDPRTERLRVSPGTAVAQSLRHLPSWEAVAVLDSVQRLGHVVHPIDVELVRRRVPRRLRPLMDLADPRAESGTESIARIRLRDAGIPTLVQPELTETIRPDLLISDRLVIECVSVEHHSTPSAYNMDRRRIAEMVVLGYTVLEFTYPEIYFRWPSVLTTIESAMWTLGISKGEHPRIRALR
jgi:very-short-patch-repair endonuclease